MTTCDCPIVFAEVPNMASQIHRYDCPNAPKPLSYINENGNRKPLNNLAKLLIIESHLSKIEREVDLLARLVREMAMANSEHQWP